MRIPLYWSKATAKRPGSQGRLASFSCWRSSDVSEEDAQRSALAAAKSALQLFAARKSLGRYPYGCGNVPLREEVIQRFENSQGDLYAAVTRNGYGSLVLNSARAMFIDIDFPNPFWGSPWGTLKYLFGRLLGKPAWSPDAQQDDAKNRLEEFLHERPAWGMRIYRTCGGLRGLVTHDLFDPAADTTLAALQAVGADPMYVRLCKAQECFRARLTPKPWRCGHLVNRSAWPRDDAEQQQQFDQWLAAYMTRQSQFATCRLLGTLRSSTVHPEIETVIEVHDEITRCPEPLVLA
jgi:hypothetical protein